MGTVRKFCPNCGQPSDIDSKKEFYFCPECGNKVSIFEEKPIEFDNSKQDIDINNNSILYIEDKLKEVEFYYQLSFDKKEFSVIEKNPTYFLKAQDLLVDLSQQFPNDYRIWWELSKPVDFSCSIDDLCVNLNYKINEDYFNKALDKADLECKKTLIQLYDNYNEKKEQARLIVKKQNAIEEEKRKKEEAERLKREQEAEKLRLEQEAERLRLEEQTEKLRLEEKRQSDINNLKISESVWAELSNNNFTSIDNLYFEIEQKNNQTMLVIFKSMSNILYLNVYRVDKSKNNATFNEQSIAIHFDNQGYALKFNNSPLEIKPQFSSNHTLRIFIHETGKKYINEFELKPCNNDISMLIRKAKKPLLSINKPFV